MSDKHTVTLRQVDQARSDLNADHYRELATKLLTIARDECRLSDPQLELVALARRYKERADYLDRRARYRPDRGGS